MYCKLYDIYYTILYLTSACGLTRLTTFRYGGISVRSGGRGLRERGPVGLPTRNTTGRTPYGTSGTVTSELDSQATAGRGARTGSLYPVRMNTSYL